MKPHPLVSGLFIETLSDEVIKDLVGKIEAQSELDSLDGFLALVDERSEKVEDEELKLRFKNALAKLRGYPTYEEAREHLEKE